MDCSRYADDFSRDLSELQLGMAFDPRASGLQRLAVAAHPPTYSEDASLSLAMAIVVSSPGPLLMLDGALDIVAGSAAFAETFGVDLGGAAGQPLSSLGDGEWGVPELKSLLTATSSGAAKIERYEMDLRRPGHAVRHLVIHAQRLVYMDLENLRLLVSVSDVTDTLADEKLKDEALRQNVVLLQEVRRRVANSLQIIASVLLQNARRTQSEETRGHLNDAHHRVMSIAALERQLAGTGESEVELLAYFTTLCSSISTSMIGDSDQVRLRVTGAGGVVEARTSVSLGLIVTELVINALKHAFPDGRTGEIVVDFRFWGPDWTLSVTDDGIGMPAIVRAGLGASIVQALASQLNAVVATKPASPGTCVLVTHTQLALANDAGMARETTTRNQRPAA